MAGKGRDLNRARAEATQWRVRCEQLQHRYVTFLSASGIALRLTHSSGGKVQITGWVHNLPFYALLTSLALVSKADILIELKNMTGSQRYLIHFELADGGLSKST